MNFCESASNGWLTIPRIAAASYDFVTFRKFARLAVANVASARCP